MKIIKIAGKIPGNRKLIKPLPIMVERKSYGHIASCVFPQTHWTCWAVGQCQGDAIKRLRQSIANDLDWCKRHQKEFAEHLKEELLLKEEWIVYRHVHLLKKEKTDETDTTDGENSWSKEIDQADAS